MTNLGSFQRSAPLFPVSLQLSSVFWFESTLFKWAHSPGQLVLSIGNSPNLFLCFPAKIDDILPFHSARVLVIGASKLKVREKLQQMEFEMDIPAAEELEWLESNSLLPEYEEEEYIVVEDEEVAASKKSNLSKFQGKSPKFQEK